jgi:hypothetical protein
VQALGQHLGAEALTAVRDREGAIEMSVDLDAEPSEAAATRPRPELEEAPVELHRVIALDGAQVLETADAVEVCLGRSGPPGGCRVRRRVREVGIVAREKPVEHALGLGDGRRLSEPEFDDEAILKGAKEPLDATLGLRGVGANPADAEVLEGAADLGGLGSALELLSERERDAGIAVKDPVAVRIHRTGETRAADELAEEQEVAVGIFLQPEDATEDLARGVVDSRVEDETRPALFEPGVMTPVHLDEEPGLRHAVPAAAMASGPAGAGAADPGRTEESLHGLAGDPEALALMKQLGEVVIIHARIGGAGQREDPGPDPL